MEPETVDLSVLFADIAGSTRLIVEHGDGAARVLLLRYLALLSDTARAHGGEVVDRLGDEVFCIFPSADAAAEAAAAMHERVEAASARERLTRPIRLRIGFLEGPVIRSAEGVFGKTVHEAARLVALAKAGQILTTRDTRQRLGPRWRGAGRSFDRRVLRGTSGEEEIHELLWDASVTSSVTVVAATAPQPGVGAVELACGESRLRVDAMQPRVEIGRGPGCDLRVESGQVSRLHAAIEWNRGRVYITDLSTNGTTIERSGEEAVWLRHESAVLEGEGTLRLGGGAAGKGATLSYRCLQG